jgi:hypothetical protein
MYDFDASHIYLGLNRWHVWMWWLTYLHGIKRLTCMTLTLHIFTWDWTVDMFECDDWHIYMGFDVSHIWTKMIEIFISDYTMFCWKCRYWVKHNYVSHVNVLRGYDNSCLHKSTLLLVILLFKCSFVFPHQYHTDIL